MGPLAQALHPTLLVRWGQCRGGWLEGLAY